MVLAKRRHLDLGDLCDCIAPGLLFAQAIGRWGNWFNQELFGAPSKLPWALEIDPAHRPHAYLQYATFQPTFLYESLWCLALGLALIWVDHHLELKKFQVFALYCMGYTAGRFVFEEMRIDPAHTIGPLRLNAWVSIVRVHRGVRVVPLAESPRPARGAPRAVRRRRGRHHAVGIGTRVRVGCPRPDRGPPIDRPGEVSL